MKLTESFSTHWTKMSKELPCFGKPHISSHEWWSKLVKNTIIDSGIEEKGKELGLYRGGVVAWWRGGVVA